MVGSHPWLGAVQHHVASPAWRHAAEPALGPGPALVRLRDVTLMLAHVVVVDEPVLSQPAMHVAMV